jgi:hypothetical protein
VSDSAVVLFFSFFVFVLGIVLVLSPITPIKLSFRWTKFISSPIFDEENLDPRVRERMHLAFHDPAEYKRRYRVSVWATRIMGIQIALCSLASFLMRLLFGI